MRVLLSTLFTVKKSQARPRCSAARCGNKKISANVENQVTLDILVKTHDTFAFINRSDRACDDYSSRVETHVAIICTNLCRVTPSLRGKFERTTRRFVTSKPLGSVYFVDELFLGSIVT